MDKQTLQKIRQAYGWKEPQLFAVDSGLINHTWKVVDGNDVYLLQSVNTNVFTAPRLIDENLNLLADYFRENAPGYLFTAPLQTLADGSLPEIGNIFYRVFHWVTGSHTIDTVSTPAEAFEAAKAFGLFTSLLGEFDVTRLHPALPNFHHLSLRYYQFEQAVQNGVAERISECAGTIQYLRSQVSIVKRYEAFCAHSEVTKRVTHHDTKISNVLFDEQGKSICVIDLDTVMPGYFLSDVGDMFRTYVCPVSEEEKDLDKILIRKEYIRAIENGYLTDMGSELTGFEKEHFHFAGEMLIYMQALRFLCDYLLNDPYYGSRYPGQNKVRAENQARLLQLFREAVGS